MLESPTINVPFKDGKLYAIGLRTTGNVMLGDVDSLFKQPPAYTEGAFIGMLEFAKEKGKSGNLDEGTVIEAVLPMKLIFKKE